ncbi:MAG: hypothetical protein LBQ20_04640 [Rhodanobacter sp.]|jgi:hypothetical protein|nr:hypothetical protein [Rhodanobacter sp.]
MTTALSPSRARFIWLARALQILAALALALVLARALALWAADPLLGYANNFDQIRATRVFGLKPRDSGKEIHAGTRERPWRYYIQADHWHWPGYPSSDSLVKVVQVVAMKMFSDSHRVMDIKVAGATLLIAWLTGIVWIFARLWSHPASAFGFALWCGIAADPINLLFLNTLYAEFSAFMAATLLVGVLWLWLENKLSTRRTLLVGAMLVLFLSIHRVQYMFLGLALLPVAWMIGRIGRREGPGIAHRRRVLACSAALVVICVVPIAISQGTLKQTDFVKMLLAVNRTDTVLDAMLPVSEHPQAMLKTLKLPATCQSLAGRNWYATTVEQIEAQCPGLLTLPLSRIARAVILEPRIIAVIVRGITENHRGFLLGYLGQVEGRNLWSITNVDGFAVWSLNGAIRALPAWGAECLIWIFVAGPFVSSALLYAAGAHRWAVVFAMPGVLFSYSLFSSIFGDGYVEIERHAMLCFSFGTLFLILLLAGACSWLLEDRRVKTGIADTRPRI